MHTKEHRLWALWVWPKLIALTKWPKKQATKSAADCTHPEVILAILYKFTRVHTRAITWKFSHLSVKINQGKYVIFVGKWQRRPRTRRTCHWLVKNNYTCVRWCSLSFPIQIRPDTDVSQCIHKRQFGFLM